MATEKTYQELLRGRWIESLMQAVERPSKDAVDWLLAHGEPKSEGRFMFLELKDQHNLGQSLTLACGPGGLTASIIDEHKRTFSYHGSHKFKELIKAQKGWGVMFIDDKNTVLTISERATFELHESGGAVLQERLYGG